MKKVAVFTTSDIQQCWAEPGLKIVSEGPDLKFWSKGALEQAVAERVEIVVVTTRHKLEPTDEWWIALVGQENILLAPAETETLSRMTVNNPFLLIPWCRLFDRYGVEWPNPRNWLELRDEIEKYGFLDGRRHFGVRD
jgi:hypothetical protein